MRFCRECGTKADEQAETCKECGAVLPSLRQKAGSIESALPRFSKRTKILTAILMVVLLTSLATYKLLASYYSPEKVMERFLEAVHQEDTEYLASTIQSADKELEMSEENAKALLTYWKENNDEKKELFQHLQKTVKVLSHPSTRSTSAFQEFLSEEWQPIQFIRSGRKLYFFDNYAFVAQPINLEVYSNFPAVTFFLNGKVHPSISDGEGNYNLGPVLPGYYTIKGTLDTDFVVLSKELEAHVFKKGHVENMYFDASEIVVESNVKDGEIFVDGKSQGLKLDDGFLEFGPVLLDGSMKVQVQKDTPFGLLKSPQYKIDQEYLFVNVSLDEKEQETIMNTVNEALLSYRKALAGEDPSLLNFFSGEELRFIEEDISDWAYDDYSQWTGFLLHTKYNLDSFYLWEENGVWHASVMAESKWLEEDYYYSDGLSEYEYYREYFLKYEKDAWTIYEIEDAWGSLEDAVMVETFEFVQAEQEKDTPKPKVVLKEDSLISYYLNGFVEAVNSGDFTWVEPYLLPGSELYISQQNLVERLYDAGTKEYLVDYEILDLENLNDEEGTVLITVSETIGIQKQNEEYVEKTFQWIYTAKVYQGKYYLSKLE